MKKIIASAAAALLLGAGLTFASALPGSATTPSEDCVPREAVAAYTEVTPDIDHPAVGEPTIVIDNPDYIPAVEEESYVEYEFAFKKDHPNSPRWEREGWNADDNDQSHGWHSTGNTRVVIDVAGSDAVGEPTIEVANPDYIAPYTEDVPDIDHPAVPAVTCEEEPEPVDPIACTISGGWYTEADDLAPVATPEGLVFAGGTGQAVGIRVPVNGNLQGWSPLSFVNTGGTEQFFFRLVIDASADGGPAYKSLSFPGYTTVDADSISYQYGEKLAQTAERFPNNVITSVGFQTNSGAPAGYSATLSSVSSACAAVTWSYEVPERPADIITVTTDEVVNCETDTITTTVTTTTVGWVYDAQTNTWVATAPAVTSEASDRPAGTDDCPVVVPPTEPEEPMTPDWGDRTTDTPEGVLAATGNVSPWPILVLGVIALALGLGAVVVTAGTARSRNG